MFKLQKLIIVIYKYLNFSDCKFCCNFLYSIKTICRFIKLLVYMYLTSLISLILIKIYKIQHLLIPLLYYNTNK